MLEISPCLVMRDLHQTCMKIGQKQNHPASPPVISLSFYLETRPCFIYIYGYPEIHYLTILTQTQRSACFAFKVLGLKVSSISDFQEKKLYNP